MQRHTTRILTLILNIEPQKLVCVCWFGHESWSDCAGSVCIYVCVFMCVCVCVCWWGGDVNLPILRSLAPVTMATQTVNDGKQRIIHENGHMRVNPESPKLTH